VCAFQHQGKWLLVLHNFFLNFAHLTVRSRGTFIKWLQAYQLGSILSIKKRCL
jgi:hypothetical protein